jgi:hypothetical protein
MKLVSRNAAFLLFATIAIVSCKDDEPSKPAPDNKFSIEDDNYTIKTGMFLKDMTVGLDANNNEYYRNSVIFTTDGVTTITVDGETQALGAGDIVELMLNNAGQALEAGTYTWQSEEHEQPFDFWSGQITLDWDATVQDSGIEYNFTSGTVTVAKSDDTYTITFEGVAVGDVNHDELPDEPVTVSGQFEGKLTEGQRDF